MYAQVYPGAVVLPGQFYLSPAFHGGQDVFCAFDGGQLLAYAPVYVQIVDGPSDLPHVAWTEIKAKPDILEVAPIKDALLDCIVNRARQIAAEPSGRALSMIFQYMPVETPSVAYVQSRGFVYTESVYRMRRDLDQPIPELPTPQGIDIRRWKITSEEDLRLYVAAHNECFPESPVTSDEWRYLLNSPAWSEASSIGAFEGTTLAGCLTAYWNDEEKAQDVEQAGHTEYIFVRSPWRGLGIAGAMICEGMRYLKEHDKTQACLDVRAFNTSALSLYHRLGYEVVGESRFYAKTI